MESQSRVFPRGVEVWAAGHLGDKSDMEWKDMERRDIL